jgi:hypothetical protein
MPNVRSRHAEHSDIVDYGDGFRVIQTPGWEWNTEDVLLVLMNHGVCTDVSDEKVQLAFDLCVAQERRIQHAILTHDEFDDQLDEFLSEVESIAIEHGVIVGPKLYLPPGRG